MAISNGIDRIHGSAVTPNPFTLHGGYQMTFLKVAGSNVGTADSGGDGSPITEGNFTKAIRAIQQIGTIVYIGTRANNQFVVAVDAATINPYVSANTDTSVTAAVDAVVTAATGVSTTVTDISGLAAGVLA
jgi:hypothetical protein